ncbi:MAG TPA: alkaline phosphatase family protein [Candidatus Eremiobacteraceae bacterium]
MNGRHRFWIAHIVVSLTIATLFGAQLGAHALADSATRSNGSVLPNGWLVRPPQGMYRETDTMPQGAAASPDGKTLAVVDSGFNPSSLRLYASIDLKQIAVVPLPGAFGRPLWRDSKHILVAGDNADALFDIDIVAGSAQKIVMPAKSHPIAVAMTRDEIFAVAGDGDGSVRIGTLANLAKAHPVWIGQHPGSITFSSDGRTLFAADRSGSDVAAIDVRSLRVSRLRSGLHPTDLLVDGTTLYIVASDADSVDVFDTRSLRRSTSIFVGDEYNGQRLAGVSPNALARRGDLVFVSLGAANSVAVVRGDRLVGRIPAGWYPTDIVPTGARLFVIDGKGERTRPNPEFDPKSKSLNGYVASIQYGSIRTFDIGRISESRGNPQGQPGWNTIGSDSVVRPHGPIRHVFFILKENRSYDEVLGDMRGGDGDPKLVWFGAAITPNQHALAQRFGLFDNAFASGEVSDSGHDWADAAFANDFVERFWPPTYGGRRDADDTGTGFGAQVPKNGFMWDAAKAAHVSFRDYGEMTDVRGLAKSGYTSAPTLRGSIDPKYVGWDLDYSDLDRVKEWSREFDAFVKNGDLPQLEYIWLPNDHTSGSRVGKPTPVAYVATNDYAVGQIVDKISHSSAWKSSAIFITEDDAQDGADHVSAQRTTLYIASPYARGGVVHAHYSTVSVLKTIEIILGMRSLSTYDAMALPMTGAFEATPRQQPFSAVRPNVDLSAKNTKVAFGAQISDALDFSRPDAVRPGVLLSILAHNHAAARPAH